MKKYLTFLVSILVTSGVFSQEKPVYISKSQDANAVTLIAHNNTDKDKLITLRIISSGMMLTDDPIITKVVDAHSTKEMISLSPKPGMRGHYKYKLSARSIHPEMEIVEEHTSQMNKRIILRNSSKMKGTAIFNNVKSHIQADTVAFFVKDHCGRCDEMKKLLNNENIIYKEFNASKLEETYELMWDALLAYGVQDGRVMMPVVFYKDDVYHNIEDLNQTVDLIIAANHIRP